MVIERELVVKREERGLTVSMGNYANSSMSLHKRRYIRANVLISADTIKGDYEIIRTKPVMVLCMCV